VIKIHTASFFDKANHRGTVLSIALSQPRGYDFFQLTILVPTYQTLYLYKSKKIDEAGYTRRYNKKILEKLTLARVLAHLKKLVGNSEDVTLCCWEKAGNFCHRQLVMGWLRQRHDEVNKHLFEIGEEH